jgi:hypothetical protein
MEVSRYDKLRDYWVIWGKWVGENGKIDVSAVRFLRAPFTNFAGLVVSG